MALDDVNTVRRPGGRAASPRSALRRVAPSAVVIVVYLLIGVAAFWPVFPGISQHLFGVQADFTLSVWFLAWVPHAVAHGLNPFFSNSIFVPTGVNLAWNTASPLLGLVSAPFAAAFGPVVGANLLIILAMPVSATAGFVVLRKWHVWGPSAALGGLAYGFSPYMVGQALGHLQLMFLPLPPFIALTVTRIVERRAAPRRLGIQLGLLVAAQYFISSEVLATVALAIIAAAACVAVRNPAQVPERARAVLGPAAIALAVAGVLLAYPVWMMIGGPQRVTGHTWPIANPYHNDLLSFVVPGPLQKVSLGMRSLGGRLAAGSGATEANGYIGVPLLILAGRLAWQSRRSPRMQLAVLLSLAAALLSLGPHLAVDGRLTHIPLPFALLDHLPLLNNILPSRMCFELGACVAAVIAFGLDDMHGARSRGQRPGAARGGRARWRGGVALAGVTLAVLVGTQLPEWPPREPFVARPFVVLPAILRRAIPGGDPVAITYPYATPYSMQPMLWQAEDGFDFRLLGGYAAHPDSSGHPSVLASLMSPPALQQFLVAQDGLNFYGTRLPVSSELATTTRITLSKYHVRLVIVDRSVGGSGPVMELLTAVLGPPKVSAGQFSLWAGWQGSPKR